MKTVAADYGLKGRHVVAIRFLERLARVLSKPRAMEFFMSLYATLYGLALAVYGNGALVSMGFKPGLMPEPTINALGALITISGLMGLYGLWREKSYLRLSCAMGMAVVWGSLALHYLLSTPPLQTGAVVHGMHSVMEAVIFLRVFANLEQHWKG